MAKAKTPIKLTISLWNSFMLKHENNINEKQQFTIQLLKFSFNVI